MKGTAFYSDERTFWHNAGQFALTMPVGGWVEPPSASGYAESPESKRRFKNLLVVSGLMKHLARHSAREVTEEELLYVHKPDYLEAFSALSNGVGGAFDLQYGHDTPVGIGTYDIAKVSAGLAIRAVEDVYLGRYQNAYSLSRPPGHHATANKALGFCYLNNIALAIEIAKKRHGLGRVAIVDWDVHHGNGQQEIFYERDDVLTISLHQENCYPNESDSPAAVFDSSIMARGAGKGEGYNINIPLFAGAGNDAYLYAFDRIVAPAVRQFQPEMIIVACGYDANAVDPLARMQLHSESYRDLTTRLLTLANDLCEGRAVFVHEGGYAESYVPFCGLAVLEVLSGIRTEVVDPLLTYFIAQQSNEAVCKFQRQYIDYWAEAAGFSE